MAHPAPILIDSVAARACAGDEQAIGELLTLWSGPIRRWTLAAMGEVVRADDAAQDAVMRILKGLPGYDPSRPLEPWLRAIVGNTCTDHHRKRARSKEEEPMDSASLHDPGDRLDLDRGARRALDAMAVLGERQREVLIMVDHDGMTPSEAAAALGLAAGTVRATLFKARRTLRVHLLSQDPDLADLVGAS